MRLRFTIRAASQLDAVLISIDQSSPQGGRNVKARLQNVLDLIVQYPAAGRLTNKNGVRRLVAFPYPYLIFYRASSTEVVVHGIRHTARKPLSPKSTDQTKT